MMIRQTFSIVVIAVVLSASVALAEKNGQGADNWRVTGVAVNDVLNARMGPGTDYPVIETFAPDESGLEQITCVPFYALRHYKEMTEAQLDALPPRWCLMRGADMQRAGWVAQQFITPDNGEPTSPKISDKSDESDPLERLSSHFLKGYEKQDRLQVFDHILATLEPVDPQPSVFYPSARIGPLTMAVLALETAEGVRDRVRYRVTYGIEWIPNPPKYSPLPLSFIQVDRFSLGSAIRQDAIDSSGEEHAGPPDAFDVGPHVSWRLVTAPVMGTRADMLAVGRTEVSDTKARAMICLDNPCLSSGSNLESVAPWGEMEEAPLALGVPFQVKRAGLLTPAAAIDQLTNENDFPEPGQPREIPDLPEPFLEAVIEINLAQDSVLDASMRKAGLMDDSVAAIWRRLVVVPTGGNAQIPMAYRAETFECHRGAQFPPDGGRCP